MTVAESDGLTRLFSDDTRTAVIRMFATVPDQEIVAIDELAQSLVETGTVTTGSEHELTETLGTIHIPLLLNYSILVQITEGRVKRGALFEPAVEVAVQIEDVPRREVAEVVKEIFVDELIPSWVAGYTYPIVETMNGNSVRTAHAPHPNERRAACQVGKRSAIDWRPNEWRSVAGFRSTCGYSACKGRFAALNELLDVEVTPDV